MAAVLRLTNTTATRCMRTRRALLTGAAIILPCLLYLRGNEDGRSPHIAGPNSRSHQNKAAHELLTVSK